MVVAVIIVVVIMKERQLGQARRLQLGGAPVVHPLPLVRVLVAAHTNDVDDCGFIFISSA